MAPLTVTVACNEVNFMGNAGDPTRHLRLTFFGSSTAQSNQSAQELHDLLLTRGFAEQHVRIAREHSATQDGGNVLLLIVGSGTALSLARGLRDFIAKRGSQLRLTTADGLQLFATGEATKVDVAKLVEAIEKARRLPEGTPPERR